jgi:hypothetical protein
MNDPYGAPGVLEIHILPMKRPPAGAGDSVAVVGGGTERLLHALSASSNATGETLTAIFMEHLRGMANGQQSSLVSGAIEEVNSES